MHSDLLIFTAYHVFRWQDIVWPKLEGIVLIGIKYSGWHLEVVGVGKIRRHIITNRGHFFLTTKIITLFEGWIMTTRMKTYHKAPYSFLLYFVLHYCDTRLPGGGGGGPGATPFFFGLTVLKFFLKPILIWNV